MPCTVPAIVAMTTTPIAQRETASVTRSQTGIQRASSPGMSTLASERFRFAMSESRNRQMNRIVKPARKTLKKSPAMPSTAEIASGTETETCSAPSWTFPAAPESPSQESSSDSRRSATICGKVLQEVADAPDERDEQKQQEQHDEERRSDHRDGRGETRDSSASLPSRSERDTRRRSARKIPTKTMRNVSPIARNAPITPMAAATSNSVRIGMRSSVRRTPP